MIRREKEEELIFRGSSTREPSISISGSSPTVASQPRRAHRAAPAAKEVPGSAVADQRRRISDVVSAERTGTQRVRRARVARRAARAARARKAPAQEELAAATRWTGWRYRGPSPSGRGAIVGVASKNTGQSIRIYKGKTRLQRMAVHRHGAVVACRWSGRRRAAPVAQVVVDAADPTDAVGRRADAEALTAAADVETASSGRSTAAVQDSRQPSGR